MSSATFATLLSKYDEPELLLTPDDQSINFVDSVLRQCVFEGCRGAPFETSDEFMSHISGKTGLEVQNVTSRGGNCFFHAFWVAYYGCQPTREDISGLRHRISCRLFSKWSDPDFRSIVTENEFYAQFKEPSSGKFDLAMFLSGVADEAQANYQLEGDGLMFELVAEMFKCEIVIISAKTEGSLSRTPLGTPESGSLTVYVAWNGRERSAHYYAFVGNIGARVVKWAEFSPPAMIGSDEYVERTPEGLFFVIFDFDDGNVQSLILECTRPISRIFGERHKERPLTSTALSMTTPFCQVSSARLLARLSPLNSPLSHVGTPRTSLRKSAPRSAFKSKKQLL